MGITLYIYLTLYVVSFCRIMRDEESVLKQVDSWVSRFAYIIVAAVCSLFLWGIYGIISDSYKRIRLQLTIWKVMYILKRVQKRHDNDSDNQ